GVRISRAANNHESDQDGVQGRKADNDEDRTRDILLRVANLFPRLRDDLVAFEHDECEAHRPEERDELDRRRSAAEERLKVRRGYAGVRDRKTTRLNSSHVSISYAVFCLKTKMRR